MVTNNRSTWKWKLENWNFSLLLNKTLQTDGSKNKQTIVCHQINSALTSSIVLICYRRHVFPSNQQKNRKKRISLSKSNLFIVIKCFTTKLCHFISPLYTNTAWFRISLLERDQFFLFACSFPDTKKQEKEKYLLMLQHNVFTGNS